MTDRDRCDMLMSAIGICLIGGNHVALIIGGNHPPYGTDVDVARQHYAGDQIRYEAWCCWNAIMRARDITDEVVATI